jgi:hypothetical protein
MCTRASMKSGVALTCFENHVSIFPECVSWLDCGYGQGTYQGRARSMGIALQRFIGSFLGPRCRPRRQGI